MDLGRLKKLRKNCRCSVTKRIQSTDHLLVNEEYEQCRKQVQIVHDTLEDITKHTNDIRDKLSDEEFDQDKRQLVRIKTLCFNILGLGHVSDKCRSKQHRSHEEQRSGSSKFENHDDKSKSDSNFAIKMERNITYCNA
ncbi:hypothetical protein SNEBB_000007 [Seison nebaliae]|nr:hypothetical protein SNEBB_000007 [Seison nebaliae]